MRETNLDGKGRWTQQAVRQRYARYCRMYRIKPRDLPAGGVFSDRGWIAELMSGVIEGIEQGDLACAEIGIELIEEDGGFAFGRILKSNTARALGRCPLHDAQKDRIRARVVAMLCRGFMPPELRSYARLARRIGLGGHRRALEQCVDRSDPWACWYLDYLTKPNPGPKPHPRPAGHGRVR